MEKFNSDDKNPFQDPLRFSHLEERVRAGAVVGRAVVPDPPVLLRADVLVRVQHVGDSVEEVGGGEQEVQDVAWGRKNRD